MKVSVVIPAFNEEESLQYALPRLFTVLTYCKKIDLCNSFEILIVDDGSTDATQDMVRVFAETLEKSVKKYADIRLIEMIGNQGHMSALTVGYLEFKGDCVISLDADLQDPPEIIPAMIEKFMSTGANCIQTVRVSRKSDTFFKVFTAKYYYLIIKKLTGVQIIPNAADFRLLTRNEAKMIASLPENKKVFRLLIPYFKIKTELIGIDRQKRVAGKSKYTLFKMIKLSIDSLLGFSVKPLRFILFFALCSLGISLAATVYTLIDFFSNRALPGWTSLVLISLFGYSILTIALSVIGEYIGRIYFQLLGRPMHRYREIKSI
jgi:polyisoprenyl-phosphate glycosyltransferase